MARFASPAAHEGSGAGYPSLTRIDADHVGIVYEGSQSHLVFEKIPLVELQRPGMFHVFQSHDPLLPEARAAIDHMAEFIRARQ